MRDDYAKFNKFFELIRELYVSDPQNAHITYETVQKMFKCSRRTAERIIKRIGQVYKVKYKYGHDNDPDEKRKYFYIDNGTWLFLKPVEEYDMAALAMAKKHIKNKLVSIGLRELEQKIWYKRNLSPLEAAREMENMGRDMSYIESISGPEPELMLDKATITKLRRAIQECKKIDIQYQGAHTRYKLCPLGILCGTINNYLVAARNMDSEKYKPYTYTLNKIQDVKLTKETFSKYDFDLQEYADESFGLYHGSGPHDVEWLVAKSCVQEAKRYNFHKTQKFHDNPDGTMTVTMRADGWREMATYLFGWNGGITPIGPPELITEYQKMINNAQKTLDSLKNKTV